MAYILKIRSSIFVAFLVVMSLASKVFAATYFVYDVKTSEANPELTQSIKALVVASVVNAGGQVAEVEAGSDFSLRTDLVKLGQAYVLTVTKLKRGISPYTSRQKASSVEELDEAADRAVRAAILSTPTKKDLRVGEIKEREEDQLRRRIKSRSATYFGFGPAGFSNMGISQLSYDLAAGHLWEVTPNAAIKFLVNGVTSADMKTYFLMAQLGLHYYLTDADTAPYIGGGLGFGGSGSATSSATTIGAFAGNVGIGYQFFRTSTTQFDIFLGYSCIFGNNTLGVPGYYGLRVGALF